MPTVHTPLSQPHPCPGQQGSKTSSKHLPWEHRQPFEVSSGMEPPGLPIPRSGPTLPGPGNPTPLSGSRSAPTVWLHALGQEIDTHLLGAQHPSAPSDCRGLGETGPPSRTAPVHGQTTSREWGDWPGVLPPGLGEDRPARPAQAGRGLGTRSPRLFSFLTL